METTTAEKKSNGKAKGSYGAVASMVLVEVACEGITPLLINRMPIEVLDRLRTKEKAPKSAGSTRASMTPREECEAKVYQTPSGEPYLPAESLFACLVAAGQFIRLDGKRQVSTAKSTLLPAFMTLDDPYLKLHVPGDPATPAFWEPDMRQGRNPNGGEAVCLVRPRFDSWAFKAQIQIDTKEVGEQLIRELWDMAGRRCGVGDFRPNRKGIYGQFRVQCWEKV